MNMSVRDKGEKTMGGGFWGGVVEGANDTIQKNKDKQADMQMKQQDSAQAQAKMILQGLISGEIKPAQENETPTLNAPGMTMPATGLKNRLKAAFGLPTEQQTMPGQGYVAGDSVDKQLKGENLKYMQHLNKTMDESGNNVVYRNAMGQEVDPEIAQKDIAQGNINYTISKRETSKSGIKETPISKPEDLQKVQQQKEQSDFIIKQAQDSLNTIAEVEKGMGNFGIGGAIPAIPGLQPEKVNWQSNINTLLSKKMIDLMVQMKEASKNGATGFGQLSEQEGQVLQNASTALKKTMSPQDAQRYLNDMKSALHKIIQKKQGQGQVTTGVVVNQEDAIAELKRRGKL